MGECVNSVEEFAELLKSLGVTHSLKAYLGPLFSHVKFSGVWVS